MFVQEARAKQALQDEEENIQYDSDDNPIVPDTKEILPLPEIDHSQVCYSPYATPALESEGYAYLGHPFFQIDYPAFNKDFYTEHVEIAALDNARVQQVRRDFGMRVSGMDPPKPCLSFAHFGFDEVWNPPTTMYCRNMLLKEYEPIRSACNVAPYVQALMGAIRRMGFAQPTPIQSQAIPAALAGRDVIGIAKTGASTA